MRRSKQDAEQTRIDILDAAEQMFCTQGVASATLEKISRAAGVTRGALYWHFKDKLDLLRALHERSLTPEEVLIRNAATQGHDDPLGLLEQAAVDMLLNFEQDERQQRMFVIMNSHAIDDEAAAWQREVNADLFRTLAMLATQAQALGRLAPDLTPDEAAIMMIASMGGLLNEWLRTGKTFGLSAVGIKLLAQQMAFIRAAPATSA
ncbi:TetR family transcriptional regulator [Allorhizobium borbori]|uniref:TetR/AcrR family acrAB operon transcriptional repressor n=1 Tax=Allorhizobium borbori TaxID=485907 RepID=A0A7W6K3D5_9HYPH|nr:TetR family transcriptional regulator [Allorhizobium borbori]MBB4104425.1 TetR/AcrR family acrAB operon transcriptional repressor [Allorhizobium borbori]